jgi:hypothetical protein
MNNICFVTEIDFWKAENTWCIKRYPNQNLIPGKDNEKLQMVGSVAK